jgi:hypothetical protein
MQNVEESQERLRTSRCGLCQGLGHNRRTCPQLLENTNFDIDISGTQFKFSQNGGIDYINPKLGLDYHVKYTFNLNYTVSDNTLLKFS